ncbi:MAG TPA: MFS transporter, partial [Actinomycetales bacterium]|nr:MFS transporter [Actinomycetales bacterium]
MPRPRAEASRADLVVASIAVLLAAADTYVVVLALPDMMTGVGLGLDELQRAGPIISMFLLGYVAVLPLAGRVADLRGRVPVLIACLVLFALGSLLTATADSLGVVVVGRALQGAGGGGMVPVTIALVADLWAPERRGVPLGVVGAVQELGSVAGPLYGAGVLALAGWRAIFWVNLAGAAVLLAVLAVRRNRLSPNRLGLTGPIAVLAAGAWCLLLVAPEALADDVTLGAVYVPLAGGWWSSPLAVLAAGLTVTLAWLVRTSVRRLAHEADVVGAGLLGLALGGVVLAFAQADPSRQVVSDDGPLLLLGTAVCALLFALRQRRARSPLVPHGTLRHPAAAGALAVNLFVGAALVAALVDVPVFARATRYPDSQLGAALVLVQLLVALPVGAVAGGWLCQRLPPRVVAAAGMAFAATGFAAMTQWDEGALDGVGSTLALVVTGLGFGLAIAPVNAALLAATRPAVHGIASSLVVVARTVGMLVGLALLTAVGLRVFYARQAEIGSPLTLCPGSPADCPAYEIASRAALLDELHAIFAGAGACALVAAVLAAVLLAPGNDVLDHAGVG